MKKGDKVWVNESKLNGDPLKHEWWGEVTAVDITNGAITIKDTTGGTYDGEVFVRSIFNLEPK